MTAAKVDFRFCRPRTKPDIPPSLSVCKQLFGPVDHVQLRADLKRELKKLTGEQNHRWNFDFGKGTPLPGRYCWQNVLANEKSDSSSAYLNSCETSARTGDISACSSNVVASSNAGSQMEEKTIETHSKPRVISRKRTSSGKMTDFLRQKKHCQRERRPTVEKAIGRTARSSRRTTSPRQGKLDKFVTRKSMKGD